MIFHQHGQSAFINNHSGQIIKIEKSQHKVRLWVTDQQIVDILVKLKFYIKVLVHCSTGYNHHQ